MARSGICWRPPTYRELGVAASFRPINDVHVAGRKISGTGAAQIADAEVLTGNFLFDFDTAVIARVVRASSPAFRDQVERSLQSYMTSLRRELGTLPDPADVAARYVRQCAEALDADVQPGEPTPDGLAAIERMEQRLGDAAFVSRPGGLRRPGVKIHEDVFVAESSPELGGRRVRVTARVRQGRIEEIALTTAARPLADLEQALAGVALQAEPIRQALERYNAHRAAGLEVAAWTEAILDLRNPRQNEP